MRTILPDDDLAADRWQHGALPAEEVEQEEEGDEGPEPAVAGAAEYGSLLSLGASLRRKRPCIVLDAEEADNAARLVQHVAARQFAGEDAEFAAIVDQLSSIEAPPSGEEPRLVAGAAGCEEPAPTQDAAASERLLPATPDGSPPSHDDLLESAAVAGTVADAEADAYAVAPEEHQAAPEKAPEEAPEGRAAAGVGDCQVPAPDLPKSEVVRASHSLRRRLPAARPGTRLSWEPGDLFRRLMAWIARLGR
jgi:hypothetical protein